MRPIMRSCALILLIVSSIVALALGQSEATKYPIAITISAENRVVKAGFEASIMVRLENTSRRELDHSANINDHTGVDPNYTYDVRDGDVG
jgi:hypothetical protein